MDWKSPNNFYQKIRKTLYTLRFAYFLDAFSQMKTCEVLTRYRDDIYRWELVKSAT